MSQGRDIIIPDKDSSSDEEGFKSKIITLTRNNWVQWSCQLENYLVGRGQEGLLNPPSEVEKISPKYKKKNSGALSLLWTCVSPDLHGVLLANKGSFYHSWEALGKTCGKNSLVIMCDTLFKLMSLQYHPGTSLEKHIDSFQRIYASYESITHNSSNQMEISSTIAAAFFIRSLNQDRDLSGLVQTLYDITPFDLNTVMNRVAVEHCRRGSPVDQALLADKSKPQEQPKPPNRGGFRGRGRGAFRGRRKGKESSKEEDPLKRLEKLEKALARLQAGTTSSNVNTVSEENNESGEFHQSDSDAYIIEHILSTESWDQDMIYLDSGAGKSVVNDVRYLTNIVKVNKQVNTFSEPVKITHEGTLVFKGIHISPVYFAPKGPVNLLSVSQLVDHGCKPMYKGESFMIMIKNRVIAEFVRSGNLFVTRLHQPSIYSTEILGSNKDWHNILGHPSDSYIKHLIQSKKLSGSFTSSKYCQ
ncbi:hypothetical protein O181_073580, partial [Austropuccinia psidii MF-1]|nr:hypothetical protein [Austropuccinia psidii MF-1]